MSNPTESTAPSVETVRDYFADCYGDERFEGASFTARDVIAVIDRQAKRIVELTNLVMQSIEQTDRSKDLVVKLKAVAEKAVSQLESIETHRQSAQGEG